MDTEKDSSAVNGRNSEAEKVAYVLQAIEQVRERLLKFNNVKMQNFAKFFKKHADHIAYASVLDFHLSNSVVEGINSQAKHLQRVHKGNSMWLPISVCYTSSSLEKQHSVSLRNTE